MNYIKKTLIKYRLYIIIGIPSLFIYILLFSHFVRKVNNNWSNLEKKGKEFLLYSSTNEWSNYYISYKKYLEKQLNEYKEFNKVPDGITHFLNLVESNNLKTKSIFHSGIIGSQKIPYVTIETELTGSYSNFCSFLQLITSEPFRIDKISVVPSPLGISVSLRVRLFLSENVEE